MTERIRYSSVEDRVQIEGTRYVVIPYFSAQVPGAILDSTHDVEVSVDFIGDIEDWELVTLGVVRGDGQPPIKSDSLRQLPVALALRVALRSFKKLITDDETGDNYFQVLADQTPDLRSRRALGPTPENLATAAEIYRMTRLVHEPPLAAVQTAFDLPNRTASHWIKLARERQHLRELPTPTEA